MIDNYRRYQPEDDLFVNDDSVNESGKSDHDLSNSKDSKNKRKRMRKKRAKKSHNQQNGTANNDEDLEDKENDEDEIDIELVPEEIVLDKNYSEFSRIFDHFRFVEGDRLKDDKKTEEDAIKAYKDPMELKAAQTERLKAQMFEEDEEEDKKNAEEEKNKADEAKQSKKKMKKLTRLSVAALKQLVNRPDVVEMHDVTARDPKLLVHLKATRNTVPVPRHWSAKRKYLQGKRGFEKQIFDLPDFIKRTGIQGMREAIHEKEDSKSLKQKMREKVRPKMGKIDIDYQKLHDAFFRYQTKPRMSIHGDLYYEGKEFETKLKEKKPGNITDDLRISLGMPIGQSADKVPPPWLIAMQRYGPPPSYPSLKIPGLNAPIPEGCSFGYHAGGWGKPPVDEFGRPLYGDVFGSASNDSRKPEEEEPVDETLWGELEEEAIEEVQPDEDESDDDEEMEGEEKKKGADDMDEGEEDEANESEDAGAKTPGEGLMTPSGISTGLVSSAGLETPDQIELRKRKTTTQQIEADMDMGGAETPALYKILPERANAVGSSMMGSSKVYDLSAAKKAAFLHDTSVGGISGIDLTLNPDELDMDSDTLQSRYNQQLKQQGGAGGAVGGTGEDMSDLMAEQEAKMLKKKNKKQHQQQQAQAAATSSGTSSSTQDKDKNKKQKEFKF